MPSKFQVMTPDLVSRTLTAADIQALVLALTQGTIDGMPIGGTTPAAVAATTLSATGATTLVDVTASGLIAGSVANALTAAGTTRADALVLTKQINNITTAAASTGAVLPALTAGQFCIVFNGGASPAQIYGAGTTTIDGVAAATGVPLTNAKRAIFICVAANTVISAQLGVVSA